MDYETEKQIFVQNDAIYIVGFVFIIIIRLWKEKQFLCRNKQNRQYIELLIILPGLWNKSMVGEIQHLLRTLDKKAMNAKLVQLKEGKL
ncbi:MAG TPA: hypothetical protein VFD17_01030 [Clostridia bacterium]|nr:hypothetical protein [Clostridia bacterium]